MREGDEGKVGDKPPYLRIDFLGKKVIIAKSSFMSFDRFWGGTRVDGVALCPAPA